MAFILLENFLYHYSTQQLGQEHRDVALSSLGGEAQATTFRYNGTGLIACQCFKGHARTQILQTTSCSARHREPYRRSQILSACCEDFTYPSRRTMRTKNPKETAIRHRLKAILRVSCGSGRDRPPGRNSMIAREGDWKLFTSEALERFENNQCTGGAFVRLVQHLRTPSTDNHQHRRHSFQKTTLASALSRECSC